VILSEAFQPFAGRKVLVTGARGFLGSRLVGLLAAARADVIAVSRGADNETRDAVRWLRADLSGDTAVEDLLEATRPENIFQFASHGVGSPERENVLPTFKTDLATTVAMLEAATRRGVRRLMLASSLEEPIPGSGEIVPSSPYAAAKWAGGAYARMFQRLYGTPVVMTRPYMAYGPGQRAHKLIPYVILALLRGEAPRLASGRRGVDWIYVDDVLEGMSAAMLAAGVEGLTFDLGTGVLVPIRDAVELVVELMATKVQPLFGALPDRPVEQERAADVAMPQEKLGWAAKTSLREGLARTIAWYRESPPIP
jgi:nucleoside-diphosphate-sugar epimerase